MTTKIFQIEGLTNFLRYGAPLARLRPAGARSEINKFSTYRILRWETELKYKKRQKTRTELSLFMIISFIKLYFCKMPNTYLQWSNAHLLSGDCSRHLTWRVKVKSWLKACWDVLSFARRRSSERSLVVVFPTSTLVWAVLLHLAFLSNTIPNFAFLSASFELLIL